MPQQYKIILAGARRVGKSTVYNYIRSQLNQDDSPPVLLPSADVEEQQYFPYQLSQRKTVTLWDTGGMERYDSMTANYFHLCHAMILVYDPDPRESTSITALGDWIKDCMSYNSIDSVALSLWANQTRTDYEDTESVELQGLMETYSISPSMHFKVSGLTGQGIMEAFNKVVGAITSDNVPVVSDEMSRSRGITLSYDIDDGSGQQNRRGCWPWSFKNFKWRRRARGSN